MTFPRVCGLVLAAGGIIWALLLLWYTFGFLHYSAGTAFLWVLIWLPGYISWYAYIRRAFGHFLCRRALVTWLVSAVANGWSLFFMWLYFGEPAGRELPVIVWVAFPWITLALVLSIACGIQERSVREPKHEVATQVGEEDFKRLLDEHRRNDG